MAWYDSHSTIARLASFGKYIVRVSNDCMITVFSLFTSYTEISLHWNSPVVRVQNSPQNVLLCGWTVLLLGYLFAMLAHIWNIKSITKRKLSYVGNDITKSVNGMVKLYVTRASNTASISGVWTWSVFLSEKNAIKLVVMVEALSWASESRRWYTNHTETVAYAKMYGWTCR